MDKEQMQCLSADEIISKVKQEAQERNKNKPQSSKVVDYKPQSHFTIYGFLKNFTPLFHKLGLSSFVFFVKSLLTPHYKNSYSIDDFCNYHNEEFIKNIYLAVLERDVDEEAFYYYQNQLKTGKKTKVEILASIRFSKEGREKNIKIIGIKKIYFLMILYKIPYISYISKIFITIFTIPRLLQKINAFEANYFLELKKIRQNEENLYKEIAQNEVNLDKKITQVEENLDKKIIQNKTDILKKADQKELQSYFQTLNYTKEYMKLSQQNMQTLIDEAKKRLPSIALNEKELHSIIKEKNHMLDTFYIEFEDKFRGTREDIKQKLKVYLPYVQTLPFKKQYINAIDIGCGRGEWLEILREQDIQAKGVDLNGVMVSITKELGLDAINYDAINYLKTQPDDTFSFITGFHIIEHLSFESLMDLFKESYRTLQKGGMIIFETPNSRNILVSASDFYLDPTHINPLHPATLSFIASQNSFSDAKVFILAQDALIDFETLKFDDIYDYINIGRDMVLIGYKN